MGSTILLAQPVTEDRAAFVSALQGTPYRVIAELSRSETLMDAVERHRPWCVVVDLQLPGPSERPGESGVSAVKRVSDKHPQIMVLVTHDAGTTKMVPGAMQAGGVAALKKPLERAALLETLEKLNHPRGEAATSRMMAVRIRKSFPISYKAVDDGFFTKKRSGLTTELGLMGVVIHTEEKLARGKTINLEIEMPGEAPIKAKMQAQKVEPVAGLPHFEVTLAYVDMAPDERERLKLIFRRLLERGTTSAK